MSVNDFVHLHVHTEYSLLDGANRIKDLLKHTKELGMSSIAITDHGVMYGVIDFYKEAIKNQIKPIIGCEVYTAKRTRFDKQPGLDSEQGHLVLLAKNLGGYKNLLKIVSIGFTEGFYYKPRIDFDVLRKYNKGIIALSACLSGDVAKYILENNFDKAKQTALELNNIFGQENFYLELQVNKIPEQNIVNQNLIKISNETGIPLIATNDAHYLKRQDARAHEILLCIQTGKNIADENRMKFSSDDFYIKSPDEMNELFKFAPSAIKNTLLVADRCNVELKFNELHLPKFYVPSNIDSFDYLKELCINGLNKVYNSNVDDTKKDRLNYELNIIKQMGYVDYFLIVWDFIKYAKDNNIIVGPGRGSAAGSLVSYTLGITNIDPLKYNLLFERFLNPERISMPDIDIDFCFERRQEVINYVVNKYGEDRVAQIITFGTMAARGAIRDVGRALNIPYNEVDIVAKMVPFQIGMTIDKALEINSELKNIYNSDHKIADLIDTARLLEGMPRHASTHAAGVVISKEPISNYVPLQKNDECITTQFTFAALEELGLLKMDFLGLRTLTVIRDSISIVKETKNIDINIDKLEMHDPNVFNLIGEGKTAGVFQLESVGMKQFMKELKPASLEDIIAGISLYRPGPMDQIPRYLKNKNSPECIVYKHKLLENILDVTYGCIIYQEQVMQIVRDLAGYSMGRSDLVRRAMSKKKLSVMEEERKNFIYGIVDENSNIIVKGAVRNGVDETIANSIFDEMIDFASYAFNKSHAAAYAVIAYQTAWFKTYYKIEFMAALLNSFLGNGDKVSEYITECKSMKIDVLPPDINESSLRFRVINNKIRFGMAAIKNVGEGSVNSIVAEREQKGSFKSFRNFLERMEGKDINKRCIESLIKSGAFNSFGIYRSKLIAVFEKMIDEISYNKKRVMTGQLSLFDDLEFSKDTYSLESYPAIEEYSNKVLLAMEKEVLGFYVSGHPLIEYENILTKNITHYSYDFVEFDDESHADSLNHQTKKISHGAESTVGGIITVKKTKTTKNNNLMAYITLEDMFGAIEVLVFPSTYEKYSKLLVEGNIVIIKGSINVKEEEQPKIVCNEVIPIDNVKSKKLYLKLNYTSDNKELIVSIKALLKYFSGNTPVYFYDEITQNVKLLEQACWVDLNDCILKELELRLGNRNVKIV